MKSISLIGLMFALVGCAPVLDRTSPVQPDTQADLVEPEESSERAERARNAYFGDLHVHTRYSFDAFAFGALAGPNEAYAFAKGDAIQHPGGFDMHLDRPLDFLGVADHGVYLGMVSAMTDPSTKSYDHPVAEGMRNIETASDRLAAFNSLFPYLRKDTSPEELIDKITVTNAWSEIIRSANRHNDPGKFTAFIAYEYTASTGQRDNLHRNVIFEGSTGPVLPFTRLDSSNPEDLWAKMDEWRALGIDSIAIPHNSNGSGGRMFQLTYSDDETPIDTAYAETRMRNEPIVEIRQVKGTSETHPAHSPNDEWADFETTDQKVASMILSEPDGSYVRQAYGRGLELANREQGNPYEFGLIGSSDIHVAAGAFDEDDYWAKVGLVDATAELRGSVPIADLPDNPYPADYSSDGSGRLYHNGYFQTWGASGLAGVWASENTRTAIFEAMRRRETFATSGPRIRVRFFAGNGFSPADLSKADFIDQAYENGVPMGGELNLDQAKSPDFVFWALRDPLDAPVQRVQVVKVWVNASGESHERVFDVKCSDGLKVDPDTHRCPGNGASVDLATCDTGSNVGAEELKTVWQDPDFTSGETAAYYVRVIQNPTCRWSTWDALREGVAPRQDLPATIQDRAWSSPIWVRARAN